MCAREREREICMYMRENIVLNSSSLEFFESQDCRFESRQTNSLKYIRKRKGARREILLYGFLVIGTLSQERWEILMEQRIGSDT